MQKYSTGCLVNITPTGVYEVICPNCNTPFGTMTPEQVRRAIFATMGRGGVLCPSCRARTCDFCGLTKAFSTDVKIVFYRGDPDRWCWVCDKCWELLPEDAGWENVPL